MHGRPSCGTTSRRSPLVVNHSNTLSGVGLLYLAGCYSVATAYRLLKVLSQTRLPVLAQGM